jgi:hypothetical protein
MVVPPEGKAGKGKPDGMGKQKRHGGTSFLTLL